MKIEGGESEGTGRVDRVREGRLKREVRERERTKQMSGEREVRGLVEGREPVAGALLVYLDSRVSGL